MNRTAKKGIILLSVYIIVLAGLLLIPGFLLNLIFSNAIAGTLSPKYVDVASYLADLDSCNKEELNKALIMRDALSDSMIDGGGIAKVEFSYLFYSPDKNVSFSEGVFARVCKEDEKGNRTNYTENFALIDLRKLSDSNDGILETLSDFARQDTSCSVKINQYALDGYECYPLSMSLYHDDRIFKTVTCYENLDTSNMRIISADDVWMHCELLPDKLTYVELGSQDCQKQLNKIKNNYNYSVEGSANNKKITPFNATLSFAFTKNGYGLLSVSKLHTEGILAPLRLFCFIGWTVLMGIISTIVLLVGRKK